MSNYSAKVCVRLLASLVMLTAFIACVGHAARISHLWTWHMGTAPYPGMAINTAFCMFLIGLCLLIFTNRLPADYDSIQLTAKVEAQGLKDVAAEEARKLEAVAAKASDSWKAGQ